jgi:hypothetical protein
MLLNLTVAILIQTQYDDRVLHLDTGRAIHHLTLDSAFLTKKKILENGGAEDDDSTIVWQVLVLADGTLVTGRHTLEIPPLTL